MSLSVQKVKLGVAIEHCRGEGDWRERKENRWFFLFSSSPDPSRPVLEA